MVIGELVLICQCYLIFLPVIFSTFGSWMQKGSSYLVWSVTSKLCYERK